MARRRQLHACRCRPALPRHARPLSNLPACLPLAPCCPQREKHFRCPECGKKLNTTKALSVHCLNVHKRALSAVPGAIDGRDDPAWDIFGMAGVPVGMKAGDVPPHKPGAKNAAAAAAAAAAATAPAAAPVAPVPGLVTPGSIPPPGIPPPGMVLPGAPPPGVPPAAGYPGGPPPFPGAPP